MSNPFNNPFVLPESDARPTSAAYGDRDEHGQVPRTTHHHPRALIPAPSPIIPAYFTPHPFEHALRMSGPERMQHELDSMAVYGPDNGNHGTMPGIFGGLRLVRIGRMGDIFPAPHGPQNPLSSNHPDVQQAQEAPMFFQNYDEAHAATRVVHWITTRDDDTVPTSEDEKRAVVKKLVVAMKDTTAIKGNVKNPAANGLIGGGDNQLIEARAWEVMNEALRLHEEGCLDNQAYSSADQRLNFEARIGCICTLFRHWKQAVALVLKGQSLPTFVAAPCEHTRRKESNAKGNAAKAELLRMGRTLQN